MIRWLEYTDLNKEYFELLEQLSKTDFTLRNGVSQEFIDRVWAEYMNQPNKYVVVYQNRKHAECPLQVIGTASVLVEHKMLHYGSKIGHIEDVVVHKCGRGLNIGKQMIEKCVDLCRKQNCYKVVLECSDENVTYYEQFGFNKHDNSMRLDL